MCKRTKEEKETMILLEHLGYKLGQRHLLYDINWNIKRGEHWVVFGMNGCGKTTLLSVLAGYCPYTTGSLQLFGEEYTADNVFAIRKRIGWVSSSFFDKHFRYENVLHIVLSGLNGTLGLCETICDNDVRKAKKLLDLLGLSEKIHQSFYKLSKGERQSVLIARALIAEPEILLLDEPGTGLDIYARERMLRIVQLLAEEKQLTIIYVTHYTEEILPLFENCMLMKNGRVFQIGKTTEIFQTSMLETLLEHSVEITIEKGRPYITVPEKSFGIEKIIAEWK